MNKKSISYLMFGIMLFSLLFISSCSFFDNTPTTSSKGLSFSLNEDGNSYTATGIGHCKEKNIVIDTYNNLPVTRIENQGFANCSELKSVVLSDCVKYIGVYAFGSCENLESITIPNNIETVRDTAFHGCPKLSYNELNDGYYLGNEQNPYLIFIKPMREVLRSITISDETRFVHGNAFYEYNKVKHVILGNKIEHIGGGAFEYSGIESIVIPDSVKTIGSYAFSGTGLKEITLGKNVVSLESGIFSRCSISYLSIPDSVEYIDSHAFDRCTSLREVYISANNSNYKIVDGNILTKDGKVFVLFVTGNDKKTFTIPDGVVEIMDNAFRERNNVYNVIVPDSVVRIGEAAFYYCSSLSSIKLSENLEYMGHHVFYHCTSLTSIVIPDKVQSLEESAFWDCTALKKITLGKGIKKITPGAFADCNNLTDIYYVGSKAEWDALGFQFDVTVHFTD